MIVHHMADGTIRKTMDGVIVPKNFETVYKLANKRKREFKNVNNDKSRIIK